MSDERYALDGWDTAKPGAVGTENFDVFADLDAAGTVTARRVFGPGFDEPVARLDPSGEVGWYGTDSQDSVRLIFDNTGTVTGSRDYTAFGAITAESGAGLDRYAYTAREWDATLGLQSNRARLYDPGTGRFTSEDPSGLSAGDVNLFRYAGNAVTTHTDPSGLQGFWDDVKMVGDYVLNNPVSAAVNFNVSQVETIGQLATKIPVETAKGFDQLGRMMVDVAGYNMVAAGRAAGYDLTYTPYSALGQKLASLPPGEQRAMALAGFLADVLSLGAKPLGEAIGDYIADGDTNKFLDRIAGIIGMNFLGAGIAKAGRPAEAFEKVPCPEEVTRTAERPAGGAPAQPRTALQILEELPPGRTLAETSPVRIPGRPIRPQDRVIPGTDRLRPLEPGEVEIRVSTRGGNESGGRPYTNIEYRWRGDDGASYTARFRDPTGNAPAGSNPNWVVERTFPGDGIMGSPTQRARTQFYSGNNGWVSAADWHTAIEAYRNGTATPLQLHILRQGHVEVP